jgi:hypothetical protein
MPSKQHALGEFFRENVLVVRAFAGQIYVVSFLTGLRDVFTPSSADYGEALYLGEVSKIIEIEYEPHRIGEFFQPFYGNPFGKPHSKPDYFPAVFAERFDLRVGDGEKPDEGGYDPGVVPDDRVGIERKMHSVEGDIVSKEFGNAVEENSGNGTLVSPKHSVVHDEKIRALVYGPVEEV